MYITKLLAECIADRVFDAVPVEVRNKALCCLFDAATCALAGKFVTGSTSARLVATRIFGPGNAPLWFSDRRLSTTGAAFANSASVCALDFDDGHRAARGHPGAAVIPAVLAAYADRAIDPDQLIAAIVAGYEIAIRIAAAQNPENIKSRQSGLWAGYGAVAAAGSIHRTGRDRLANALAINGVWAPIRPQTEVPAIRSLPEIMRKKESRGVSSPASPHSNWPKRDLRVRKTFSITRPTSIGIVSRMGLV